jgi:O-antigen/teichoic acid export membrane protein
MIWRQMLGYIPVNLANVIISFGTIVILTRLLDGDEFGRYALAVASLNFVHMIIFTWVEASMARFYARAKRRGKLASHLKTSYAAAITMGIAGLPILMALVYVLPISATMKTILAFAFASTCLTLVYNIGIEAHKAAHRIGRFSAIHSTQSLLGFSVGIILILVTPLREAAPFIGIVFGNLLAVMIDLPFMLKRTKGGKIEKDRALAYFTYGMPICFSLFLAYILSQGDLFFIKYFMGDLSVGEYNAGYNLANRSLDVLFVWIAMAVTPIAITTLEQEGVEKTKEILKKYGEFLLLIILPAATGIALVAEPAGFVLGTSVRDQAVRIMPWIAFAGVMNGFITYYAQRAFMLSRKTGTLAATMVLPVLINVGLNIWLIPIHGLMGAVWATLIAYGIGLVLTIIVAKRSFPLPLPFKALVQCTFACLVMVGIVLALPAKLNEFPDVFELIVKSGVGAVVYCFVAFAINAANCRNLVINF